MFRIPCPRLVLAVLASGLSINMACAQAQAPHITPHIDLGASLQANAQQPERLQFDPHNNSVQVQLTEKDKITSNKLFNDPKPAEGGWKGLARLLEALTPGVDTAIPLSASQITTRIAGMLNQGRNQEALDIIQKRSVQLQAQDAPGTDVQLLFLHGRALAALGRHNEAIDLYLDMTSRYPELPEPWNNLASEYVKQGKLDMAYDALHMALTADPAYATAQANMGEVQLMLAQQSFQGAAQLGIANASSRAQQTLEILKN